MKGVTEYGERTSIFLNKKDIFKRTHRNSLLSGLKILTEQSVLPYFTQNEQWVKWTIR